jgi:hypothetical protein
MQEGSVHKCYTLYSYVLYRCIMDKRNHLELSGSSLASREPFLLLSLLWWMSPACCSSPMDEAQSVAWQRNERCLSHRPSLTHVANSLYHPINSSASSSWKLPYGAGQFSFSTSATSSAVAPVNYGPVCSSSDIDEGDSKGAGLYLLCSYTSGCWDLIMTMTAAML